METQQTRKYNLLCGAAICAIAINSMAAIAAAPAAGEGNSNDANTTTPIKHVIVIIGENRTFDHLFATYQPVKKSETVLNLLSQGIVKDDGSPGKNYPSVAQFKAQEYYSLSGQPFREEPIPDPAGSLGRRRGHSNYQWQKG